MKQVIFDDLRSWDDLDMFLSGNKDVPPVPDRTLIRVPGMNGNLDITHALTDNTTYSNRSVTLEFAIKNFNHDWENIFADIKKKIHGKQMKVSLSDSDYYYDAFVTVASTDGQEHLGIVVVNLDAFPFQIAKDKTQIITNAVPEGNTVFCKNSDMPVHPTFKASGAFRVSANGMEYYYSNAGEYTPMGIEISPGGSEMVLTGNNIDVIVSYREGRK